MEKATAISVDRNAETTRKMRGGITGKGWLPGRSGNPGGRRPLPEMLRERRDELTPEAVEAIAKLARSAESETVRLQAWVYLLNRRFGRPLERVQQEGAQTVNYVAPTAEQLAELAEKLLGRPDEESARVDHPEAMTGRSS